MMEIDQVEMAAIETSGAVPTQGWLDSIKERFASQEPWAIELVIFGLGGFVLGFLLKNFGKLMVIGAVVAVALIIGLHYTHVYPFEKLQALLGFPEIHNVHELLKEKIVWGKEHPVALVSGIVGLLVGWKVG